jgi:formylglycine-generating enzyme required for sulfatase activity/nitrate/TMAO reductase-like tetraheme cytochrome c subunit
MALSGNFDKKNKTKKKLHQRKGFYVLIGFLVGVVVIASLYQTSVYFSTNESCTICHVHPHATDSWKLSTHVNNGSGVMTNCVDCHLPPKENTWKHYTAKAALGLRDVWGYLTKDSADFDWDRKSELEYAVKYIPNESCVKCHQNLFPEGITDDGVTAHLYYEENQKKLNLQCISCHLDAGHYNPNYVHGKMTGIPTAANQVVDSSKFYKEPALLTRFENFTEQIPGTAVSFKMVAIKGGKFNMGSPEKEPFHKPDESPVHEVTLNSFFMAEVETTWDEYWAFYTQTMSEGRTPPEVVYENNLKALDVDAISGPTPPFGFPDQGWGSGDRPAITMTHYAAEVFCQWLSKKTGKKYRLPTEAEWEYAARGGTQSPYFFSGNPKQFSDHGFLKNIFKPKTDSISSYVIYAKNSNNRTQPPSAVLPNPFGLKNMLGNVMEYCADKYDPEAYGKLAGATNPLVTQGEEWVVRGGNYTSDAADVRCASRDYTKHEAWLKTDPQQPKSIWWYSDIKGIGFRVVCEPDPSILK